MIEASTNVTLPVSIAAATFIINLQTCRCHCHRHCFDVTVEKLPFVHFTAKLLIIAQQQQVP